MTTSLLLKSNWLIYGLISHNIWVSVPLKNTTLFLPSPLLNLQAASCPSPPFLENPSYLSLFYGSMPKIRFFSEAP